MLIAFWFLLVALCGCYCAQVDMGLAGLYRILGFIGLMDFFFAVLVVCLAGCYRILGYIGLMDFHLADDINCCIFTEFGFAACYLLPPLRSGRIRKPFGRLVDGQSLWLVAIFLRGLECPHVIPCGILLVLTSFDLAFFYCSEIPDDGTFCRLSFPWHWNRCILLLACIEFFGLLIVLHFIVLDFLHLVDLAVPGLLWAMDIDGVYAYVLFLRAFDVLVSSGLASGDALSRCGLSASSRHSACSCCEMLC